MPRYGGLRSNKKMKYFERLGRPATTAAGATAPPKSPKSSSSSSWRNKTRGPAPPPFYSPTKWGLLRQRLARAWSSWKRHPIGKSKSAGGAVATTTTATSSPVVTCTATPETTSLIDLDDLSLYRDDSYFFKSMSSDSKEDYGPTYHAADGGAFYWEEPPHLAAVPATTMTTTALKVGEDASVAVASTSDASLSSEMKRTEARHAQLRRSLRAVLQKTRSLGGSISTASSSGHKSVQASTKENHDDAVSLADSAHFSISTEQHQQQQPHCPCVTISVTVGDDDNVKTSTPIPAVVPPRYEHLLPFTPSDNSDDSSQGLGPSKVHDPASFATPTRDETRTTISLDQFMEEKRREEESTMTGPMIALADVDGASVDGSVAMLDVDFGNGDYPQLVLTPSHDGTASRITGCSADGGATVVSETVAAAVAAHSPSTLGASYPHPAAMSASNRSVSSFDTAKKNISCTPRWLNDNIDRVWKQIDQGKHGTGGAHAIDANTSQYTYLSDEAASELESTVNNDDSMNEDQQHRVDEFIYRFSKGDDNSGGLSELEPTEVDSYESDDFLDNDSLEDDDSIPPPPPFMPPAQTDDPSTAEQQPRDGATAKGRVCDAEGFPWVEDLWSSWSAEEGGGALSISNMIEKDVIHPILKPICHLVEATEIPECGARCHRSRPSGGPTTTATPLNRSHGHPTSYRMTPRIVSPS